MPAGYSGTPLARKLGIKPGFHHLLYYPTSNYFHLFSDLPEDLVGVDVKVAAIDDDWSGLKFVYRLKDR